MARSLVLALVYGMFLLLALLVPVSMQVEIAGVAYALRLVCLPHAALVLLAWAHGFATLAHAAPMAVAVWALSGAGAPGLGPVALSFVHPILVSAALRRVAQGRGVPGLAAWRCVLLAGALSAVLNAATAALLLGGAPESWAAVATILGGQAAGVVAGLGLAAGLVRWGERAGLRQRILA